MLHDKHHHYKTKLLVKNADSNAYLHCLKLFRKTFSCSDKLCFEMPEISTDFCSNNALILFYKAKSDFHTCILQRQ